MLKTVGNPSTRYGDQTIIGGNAVIGTAGKGIDFSANPNAAGMTSELLNWYEEGTFTPIVFGTGVVGTPTYTTQAGRYTRIGRMVYIQLNLAWSAFAGATGAMKIGGLPYTSNANVTSMLSVGVYDMALTANNFLIARIETSTTDINLLQIPTGGGAWNTVPVDANVLALEISGCYTV